MERRITFIGTPEEADAADREHYAKMTPQERLDEMIELLNKWGHWNERRLERIVQVLDVPER